MEERNGVGVRVGVTESGSVAAAVGLVRGELVAAGVAVARVRLATAGVREGGVAVVVHLVAAIRELVAVALEEVRLAGDVADLASRLVARDRDAEVAEQDERVG